MKWEEKILDFAQRPIDGRSYAWVRFTYGLILLIHIVALWPDRMTFFSTEGMIPADIDGNGRHITMFAFIQGPQAVSVYFILSGIAAITLALGIFPRLSALAALVWMASLTNHISFAAYGADFVMRSYAFLILISPLGQPWPLFSRRKLTEDTPSAPHYGIVLMRLQLAVIYLDTAVAKCFSEAWLNGTAVAQFMLSVYSQFRLPVFAESLWISQIATYGTLALEFALPFLLFNRRTRAFGIFCGIGLHVGITVAAPSLWLFSLAMLPGYVAFIDLKSEPKSVATSGNGANS